MSKAIKSKYFDASLLSSEAPERKKSAGFSFTSIPIKYDGKDVSLKSKVISKYLSTTTKEINLTPWD